MTVEVREMAEEAVRVTLREKIGISQQPFAHSRFQTTCPKFFDQTPHALLDLKSIKPRPSGRQITFSSEPKSCHSLEPRMAPSLVMQVTQRSKREGW